MSNELCCIDHTEATIVRDALAAPATLQTAADLFKMLGEPGRLRIMQVLLARPMCVKDLSTVVGMQQTAVSHQLKLLRLHRLVKSERQGKMMVYSLDDEHVEQLLSIGLVHAKDAHV